MAAEETKEKGEIILEHEDDFKPHSQVSRAATVLQRDVVAPEAVGGLYEEMPKGYYWSKQFIGTLIVRHFHFRKLSV